MAVKALKEKLEEKLQATEEPGVDIVSEESNNIVPFGKGEPPMLSVVPELVITLNEAKQRIALLQEFVRDMMIPSVDYGIIPKCDKPSLFKSGAEKLCDIFGFSKQIEIINRFEDWEKGIFSYEVKTILISKRTGLIEAEGIGCCNNREKKYSAQHAYSIANTILKMAKKRAFIDAVLSATRSSGLFSQDIEDFEDIEINAPPSQSKRSNSKKSSNLKQEPVKNSATDRNTSDVKNTDKTNVLPISKQQFDKIHSIVTHKGISINTVQALIQERYNVSKSTFLTSAQAKDFINFLKNYQG